MTQKILIGLAAFVVVCIVVIAGLYNMGAYPTGEPKYKITSTSTDRFNLRFLHPEHEWFDEEEPLLDSPYSEYTILGQPDGIWAPILDHLDKVDDLSKQSAEAKTQRQKAALKKEFDALEDGFLPKRDADRQAQSNYFKGVMFTYRTRSSIWNEETEYKGVYDDTDHFIPDFPRDFVASLPIYIKTCGYDGMVDEDSVDFRMLCRFRDEGMKLNWIDIDVTEQTVFSKSRRWLGKPSNTWDDKTLYNGDRLIMDGYMACELDEIRFTHCEFRPDRIEVIPR